MTTTRRTTELRLLILALLVAMGAYAAVSLAHDERVDSTVLVYGATLAAMFGVAHLAVRRFAPAADPLLLPIAALLNGIGLAVIRRLDLAATGTRRDDFAPLQLGWTAVGIALFVLVLVVVRDHKVLDRYRYTLMVIGICLLLVPTLPGVGAQINGARLWVRVGNVSFQPSELAKLCLIAFFASYFVAKRELLSLATRRVLGLNLPRARDLGPVLLAWAASVAVLVRERDLGSSLLFFGIFVVMLYVATERTSWLLIGLGLFAGGTFAAYQVFGHVRSRVETWLDPFADAAGHGYQLLQGLFGMATGGIVGTGLGRGRPDSVPFANTDFVFAAIGEELGLAGAVAVLMLFALLVARGMRISLGVRDDFGKLFACGLAFAVALQVFVVVGGVTRLIPLTGITLPFVSYGGSSLVANYALVALLLRISDADRVPAPARAPDAELTGEMTAVLA